MQIVTVDGTLLHPHLLAVTLMVKFVLDGSSLITKAVPFAIVTEAKNVLDNTVAL